MDQITPSFYPKLYLKKVELDEEPSNMAALDYPDLLDQHWSFGENPFCQLNGNKFEYNFSGSATQKHVFYTMAVYQHTWALTSYRKSVYQLSVQTDITTKAVFDA